MYLIYIYDMFLSVNEPKHTLAVLRRTIGLEQKEMAELLGCSPATIQAVEYGKLPLSARLAERAALETGAGLDWLLDNHLKRGPVDSVGRPLTVQTFQETRAARTRPQDTGSDLDRIREAYPFAIDVVGSILLKAFEAGRVDLYVYKLLSALQELGVELGETRCLKRFVYNVREKGKEPPRILNAHPLVDYFYGMGEVLHRNKSPKPGRKTDTEVAETADKLVKELETYYDELGKKASVEELQRYTAAFEKLPTTLNATVGVMMAEGLMGAATPSPTRRRRRVPH